MAKIQQVIYNLTDNAIKFSYPDSSITIETTEKNDKVFVSVKDSGIGIPNDSLKKIWERFYKTDVSRGKDKRGTGLGLAIVKEIIQAHDENINVISTEGVGTNLFLPYPCLRNCKPSYDKLRNCHGLYTYSSLLFLTNNHTKTAQIQTFHICIWAITLTDNISITKLH